MTFFVVASLIATFNEWLTRLFDIRAKVLWKALANLIDQDGGEPFAIRTTEALRGFLGADERPTVHQSSIPRRPSATASERLANTALVKALGGVRDRLPGHRTRIDQIDSKTFATAMVELSDPGARADV